jgi:hypothetical protein
LFQLFSPFLQLLLGLVCLHPHPHKTFVRYMQFIPGVCGHHTVFY